MVGSLMKKLKKLGSGYMSEDNPLMNRGYVTDRWGLGLGFRLELVNVRDVTKNILGLGLVIGKIVLVNKLKLSKIFLFC